MRDAAGKSLILLGCVKTKLDHRAKAKDLYVSPLWLARRSYAEQSERPWMILSALYGLIDPDEEIDTYDLALAGRSGADRAAWGRGVVAALDRRLGVLDAWVFEVHAGAAYRQAIEDPLTERGARVVAPLAQLSMGYQRRWYSDHTASEGTPDALGRRRESSDRDLRAALRALDQAPLRLQASDWPADLSSLDSPGLYSWWVDAPGARDLSDGLGMVVAEGRIYAGQTGTTKWPSGLTGKMTLKARISGSHLHGTVYGSTFRRTLAAALVPVLDLRFAAPGKLTASSETDLSGWMSRHLDVAVHPFADRDALGHLEAQVLAVLDPPLNLDGRSPTELRSRLSHLRQQVTLGRPLAPRDDAQATEHPPPPPEKRGAMPALRVQQFTETAEKLPTLLEALLAASRHRVADHPSIPATPGIYLFSNQQPIYVGQSRNLRSRLRQHVGKRNDRNQASLAFRIAKRNAATAGVDLKRRGRVVELDPAFVPYFDDAKTSVAEMTVQFITLADPVERTLFEVYAALALDTGEFNSWETH